jgi:ketosteroid isomerase-like protein
MIRAMVVLLSILVLLPAAGCHSKNAPALPGEQPHQTAMKDADAQAAVNDLVHRYTDALLKKDTAALERIWADDLVFINPRGQVRTKAQRLADVGSGATAFKSIDMSEESVKTCGDAALQISRGKLVAQYSGKESSGDYRITIALCRRGSEWRIHAIQMTPITP